jgi:hypothetical protein
MVATAVRRLIRRPPAAGKYGVVGIFQGAEWDLPVARLDGVERELRLLVDHREDLVAERTRSISRLR